MARRASFGRRPRVQQNITGTLVAIAREMQNREDANIMNAWQNGGKVHGRAVTDEMVLAYWTRRRKTLDKADPSYDQINNQISQLEYAVAQSKADLLHVQGKMSDQAFAKFYLNWAKKVPRNSEFWRTLQKDAAALMATAKQKVRTVDPARARAEAFQKFQDGKYEKDIRLGEALTAAIEKQERASGKDRDGFGDDLISMLNDAIKSNPGEYRELIQMLNTRGNYNGTITRSFLEAELSRAEDGAADIADRAKAGGYVGAWKGALDVASKFADWHENTNGWDVGAAYLKQEALWRKAQGEGSSIIDRNVANQRFAAWAEKQSKNTKLDPATRSMYATTAARLNGKGDTVDPSLPDVRSTIGGGGGIITDEVAQKIAWDNQQVANMQANPDGYVYAPVDRNGKIDPNGTIEIVSVSALSGLNTVPMPQQTTAGTTVNVAAVVETIYAQDPNNPKNLVAVGQRVQQRVGAQTISHVTIQDSRGRTRVVGAEEAMADGVTESRDGQGRVIWSMPQPTSAQRANDLLVAAQAIDKNNGGKTSVAANIQAQLEAGVPVDSIKIDSSLPIYDANTGSKSGKTTYSIEGGRIVANDYNVAMLPDGTEGETTKVRTEVLGGASNFLPGSVIDPTMVSAPYIPGLTYNSATARGLSEHISNIPPEQARAYLSDEKNNFEFIKAEMAALGTNNPYDPRIARDYKDAQIGAQILDQRDIERNVALANYRVDLEFPGVKTDAAEKPVSISFGGQTLSVPKPPPSEIGSAVHRGDEFAGLRKPDNILDRGILSVLGGVAAKGGVAPAGPPSLQPWTPPPKQTPMPQAATPGQIAGQVPVVRPITAPSPGVSSVPGVKPIPIGNAYSGPPGSRFG